MSEGPYSIKIICDKVKVHRREQVETIAIYERSQNPHTARWQLVDNPAVVPVDDGKRTRRRSVQGATLDGSKIVDLGDHQGAYVGEEFRTDIELRCPSPSCWLVSSFREETLWSVLDKLRRIGKKEATLTDLDVIVRNSK